MPLLVWFPLTATGIVWIYLSGNIQGPGLWTLIAGQVLAWIALNYLGLYDNGHMRRDSMRNLALRRPPPPGPVLFVGCSTAKFHSIVDPHQDIGYLSFGPDELEFIGEDTRVRISRPQVTRVRFLPNIHSMLCLGRWISIEGLIEGQQVRLLIESREKDTLLGNLMMSGWLKKTITEWRAGKMPLSLHDAPPPTH